MSRPEKNTGNVPVIHTDYRIDRPVYWHYKELNVRREESPFYWNDSTEHGYWMVQRYEHVLEALNMPDVFSNRNVNAFNKDMTLPLLPHNLDGLAHQKLRAVLNPFFMPQMVKRIQDHAQQRAKALMEEIQPKKSLDFARGFAILYPTEMFLTMVNLPLEDGEVLLDWVEGVFEGFFGMDEASVKASEWGAENIHEYFRKAIEERKRRPGDPKVDFITRMLEARVDGEPLKSDDILTCCMSVMLAGLDTTRSALGYIIHHLAHDDELRHHLTNNPDQWPHALEEFLRLYSLIIQNGRQAVKDIDFHGCSIKEGDMVWLGIAQANRDPRRFDNPDEFIMNRPNIKESLAFSANQHRCLGVHLARLELNSALVEWHKLIPNYRVVDADNVMERGGQLRLQKLLLEWD